MSEVIRHRSLLSDSGSRSYSTLSEVVGKTVEGVPKRDRWRKHWHYIACTVGYCISTNSYSYFIGNDDDSPNLIQDLASYFFFGMPVMYMQIALGQYTQMGLFYLRHCVPLLKGLGYTFLFCVLIESTSKGFVMMDELMYLMLSFQPTLPWSHCPEEFENICTPKNTTAPDKLQNYSHTALMYWRYVYMENPTLRIADVTTFNAPSLQRIVGLVATWSVTFGVICACCYNHRKVSRTCLLLYIIGNMILIFVVVLTPGALAGLSALLETEVTEFYSLRTWSTAIRRTISGLSLAELYHMYAGASLPPTAQAGVLAFGCVFSMAVMRTFLSAFAYMCDGLVEHHVGVGTMNRYEIRNELVVIFMTIPQGLSYLRLPQVWTIIYFSLNIMISMCNQVLHLFTMQMAVNDMYPNFYKYRVYVCGVICVFNTLVGLILVPDSVFAITDVIFQQSSAFLQTITVLLLTIMIFWIYGVTSLSDDIHYISGSQPTKYWKICWHIIPIIIVALIAHMTYQLSQGETTTVCVAITASLLLSAPIIISGVTIVLAYIKKGNLLGTIRPTELWGPPDPEERTLRRMFNPRLETRFEAHKMLCGHSCLFGNKLLKNIWNQENVVRREYLINLMETKGIKVILAPEF